MQAGRAEVRAVIERAEHRRSLGGDRGAAQTVLFLDEIHRFNKAQQDALLPAVEDGLLTLIGATTENPAFEVNGALLSRMRVYALQALSAEEVATVLRRASPLAARSRATRPTSTRTRSSSSPRAAKATRARRSTRSSSRARRRRGACRSVGEAGEQRVTLARVEDALQRRAVLYDKGGDRHYDYISAWIKATRGSDPDASLYYLAVMLEGGEDPRFIVRRMVILASEDIGNADPQALSRRDRRRRRRSSTSACPRRATRSRRPRSTWRSRRSPTPPGRALGAARRHVREHGARAAAVAALGPPPGQDNGGLRQPARPSRPRRAPAAAAARASTDARFYEPDEAEAQLAARLREIRRARAIEER